MNHSSNIPTGPAWAAILAAAIGCFAFAVAVDLAEAFPAVSRALNLYNPTGDLSGKSTFAVAVWLVSWAILHARWKNRMIISVGAISSVILVLILLAVLATFPPIFGLL